MKLKKMNKNQLIIAIIIILNILIITLPYSIKNYNLKEKLEDIKLKEQLIIENKDFYKIYDEFNKVLSKLDILPLSKSVSIDEQSLSIDISLDSDITSILSLLTYIDRYIPDMIILSSNINRKSQSSIVFYIEN